ncbi:MAG: DUF5906 domain-containing protein [Eubacteriales bacterium]|nr:DUF5906 domain-containing protein [Eubacteriales bacterium]
MGKEETKTVSADTAAWFDGKAINEVLFCEEFLRDYPMISVGGTFFTVNGLVNDEIRLQKEIYNRIKPYVTSNLSKKVANLLDVMRIECCTDDLLLYQDRIHVANGTYHLDGTFSTEKDYCRNRLPVAYNPEAPQPVTWLHFLSQLLEPEDILTVQEFIGYCFIPSTKGQKMLMLTGKGGEGKSRIGVVLRALLGVNMKTGSLQKVETNNYARADLEHELLMLDDDMKLEALPQTNIIKAIITAELPMDLERKRQQSYQGDMYVRFIGFGNGVLQALHDRSVGFFRRQIILTTKDKDPNRKDDPYIAEKMVAEAEGIFLWALEGLHRLIANDFQFTLSQSALDNLNDAVSDGNNMIDFLASEGYIRFRADYEASSKNLYAVYKQWCEDNALGCLCQKSFCSFLKQNENRYNIEYTNKINIGGGRFARGFVGIEILQRPFL